MIGMFINTVPVRVRLDGGQPVAQILADLQQRQSALMAHQHLGLPEINELAGSGAVFDTVFMFENYPRNSATLSGPGPEDGEVAITQLKALAGTHYPLAVSATLDDRLQIRVSYRPDLFDERAAELVVRRLVGVLEQVAGDPLVLAAEVDVLVGAERSLVVERWNATGRRVRGGTLPELFARQVRRSPDAIAVIGPGRDWSYAGLAGEAGRLARYLLGLGVGPECRVAVMAERSPEMVMSLLAVSMAGGAFGAGGIPAQGCEPGGGGVHRADAGRDPRGFPRPGDRRG